MSTIRQALAQARPHVSLKTAWRVLIQTLRADRKAEIAPVFDARAPIDRLLDTNVDPEMDLSGLKQLLSELVQAPDDASRRRTAHRIDALASPWLPEFLCDPVPVIISGWPESLPPQERVAIAGAAAGGSSISPIEAAKLLRDLDGLVLAGSPLRVRIDLPAGTTLPPIPRSQRRRNRARGTRPWLPHLDEIGRYSLTPEALAEHQASLFDSHTVIDAFCGCGGDAIALARAGHRVVANDFDAHRVELARRNARHFGVEAHIEFVVGDATACLDQFLSRDPDAGVYLDPPWGGLDWERNGMGWSDLVPKGCQGILAETPRLVLKTPRSFDVGTLPDDLGPWMVHYGLGPDEDDPADRVRLLTIAGGRAGSGGS